MTRGPLKFNETDLLRAIKSAVKAGLQVTGFKIKTTGDIEIRTSHRSAEHDHGGVLAPLG